MTKQSSNARKRARKKAMLQAKKADAATKKIEATSRPHDSKKGKKRSFSEANSKVNSKQKQQEQENDGDDDLLAFAAAWACGDIPDHTSTNNKKKNKYKKKNKTHDDNSNNHQHRHQKIPTENLLLIPMAFPAQKNLPLPSSGFLRNEPPYERAFQTALETSYEGLAWDETFNHEHESSYRHALQVMDDRGLFRTDVTQPAGLGAKLVPSYVTRCLLGEEGTTYRYLGLRMFAHPWNGLSTSNNNADDKALSKALQTMQSLNQRLSERTESHLAKLKSKRQARGAPAPVGLSTYTVTLINKMTVHKRLRDEPMFGTHKYSVGWHADSSLEHFSSIAVYHTLMHQEQQQAKKKNRQKQRNAHKQDQLDDRWSVALRVAHDAEGPRAKRLGDIKVEESAPPIAVALPSGSTYYLLDDMNHHHQHAVLAPSNTDKVTRYSSTHRLLRQGHTVQDILQRCATICGKLQQSSTTPSHGMGGPKKWRSEQLLLSELENEWLRQFFIQGQGHKEMLWGYWEKPMKQLFEYWQLLEKRTYQVLQFLQQASLQLCKSKNKEKEKGSALSMMIQIQGDRATVADSMYIPLAKLLVDRAKTRDMWLKREQDPVFQRLPSDCHPIPFPVVFGNNISDRNNVHSIMARSPMPDGSSHYLTEVASRLQACGKAYDERKSEVLPTDDVLSLSI